MDSDEFEFEWDPDKATRNLSKHGVSFDEAKGVFLDPLGGFIADSMHSTGTEERLILLGRSTQARVLVVVFCERTDRIRIISARSASRKERKRYEEKR